MGELQLSKTFYEKKEAKKYDKKAFVNLRPLLGNFN